MTRQDLRTFMHGSKHNITHENIGDMMKILFCSSSKKLKK